MRLIVWNKTMASLRWWPMSHHCGLCVLWKDCCLLFLFMKFNGKSSLFKLLEFFCGLSVSISLTFYWELIASSAAWRTCTAVDQYVLHRPTQLLGTFLCLIYLCVYRNSISGVNLLHDTWMLCADYLCQINIFLSSDNVLTP
jgi:hypothetical protein